jgi:hypothetical protein
LASTHVTASIRPGALIAGRYRVESALGKGGMGSVYAVADVSTGRRLALKYLQREAAAEQGPAAALFQREYHTLAHLRHPRVIQVFDYGVEAGRPFYTMELLDGSDLRELAPLPWRRACEVLRDVASSLALLHSRRLLHRDLSPRNVRCTRDGQAKLIDFGAMTPMGVARDVAGTPPYMAPEAVHVQALDARTDLFALGALAYWTLTGHDAYPGRDSRELRQLWQRPILPPSALVGDIPEAVDALVMSLLALDPQARPGHAAEIIERLTAIAGLEPVEQLDVARSYLATPTLIGHGLTLGSFHKRMIRAGRGRGSAVLVEGSAGLGRSRLLQTLVLEGKLCGTLVLTAEADEAPPGELGVARALVASLVEAAPDLALRTFRPHAHLLGRLFPDLVARLDDPPQLDAADPGGQLAALPQALRDWLLDVCQRRALMVAVDDADRADESSLVFLALLAGEARYQKLVVAATREARPVEAMPKPLALFREGAVQVELEPLSQDLTVRLLRSVFGDVPNLQRVATWIHMLAQGKARTVMELAQYLVDRNLARYERGSWILPGELRDQALPQSVEQALSQLVEALSPAARALAEALSLVTEHGHLTLDELVRFSGGQELEQTYRAVDELVAAQVVQANGPVHHLRHRDLARALQVGMREERRRVLHLRLASLYAGRTDVGGEVAGEAVTLAAYHRYLGGDLPVCFETLADADATVASFFGRSPEAIEMYEACLRFGTDHGKSPAAVYTFRKILLQLSSAVEPRLVSHADATIVRLTHDSGLSELKHVDEPDPVSRIRECLARARRRYESAPAEQRGLEPVHALYELGSTMMMLTGAYTVRNERQELSRLPEVIAPLRLMSPVFELLGDLMHQALDGMQGRDVSARRLRTLARLEHKLDGLDEASQAALRAAVLYWLGMDDAIAARPSALERASALERSPVHGPLSAQIRSVYNLFVGNEVEAEVYRQRRELLALQNPAPDLTSLRGIVHEAQGYYLCGSVLGLKRVVRTMDELAERFPAWEPDARAARGLYELARGEPTRALREFERTDAGAAHVQALLDIGETGQALSLAEQSLRRYEAERDSPMFLLPLQAARALALSEHGEPAAAAQALELDIDRAIRDGVGGMLLCVMHEARARIAIKVDDQTAFRQHVGKLASIYGRGTSGLRARFEQLSLAAQRALIPLPPHHPSVESVDTTVTSDVRGRLGQSLPREERLRRALSMVARQADARTGYLFGMQEAGLSLEATLGDVPAPDGLEDMLAFYLNAELDAAETVPHTVTGTFESTPDMVAWINDGHALYYPLLLSCIRDQRRVVAGVAVLALSIQKEPPVSRELVADVSHALLDAGDVAGADAAD